MLIDATDEIAHTTVQRTHYDAVLIVDIERKS